MRHTISVLVENKFGVLARVAGLFSGRGFNITSLAVGETMDPAISRMTIVVDDQGSPQIMEQVEKQLNKLINVIKVQDFTGGESVDRELILIKVKTTTNTRSEILEIARIFRARVVDVSLHSVVLEITGAVDKINAILNLLTRFGVKELVRTGKIAIARS
ncbi:MAG: acetolactate synthase small subunit [Candidatus Euphemobacter frigidus]|nr:acetolactate synthase small subunit [Candidatus Euphemobacter frigidus]MDP8275768.1 acetolactate synthase small subunit [Candidatus Euphemobacter frigidus]